MHKAQNISPISADIFEGLNSLNHELFFFKERFDFHKYFPQKYQLKFGLYFEPSFKFSVIIDFHFVVIKIKRFLGEKVHEKIKGVKEAAKH